MPLFIEKIIGIIHTPPIFIDCSCL